MQVKTIHLRLDNWAGPCEAFPEYSSDLCVLHLPFVEKLWSKNKIGQRGEKMQKGRKTIKQDKIVVLIL